jgi:hypothetical protein
MAGWRREARRRGLSPGKLRTGGIVPRKRAIELDKAVLGQNPVPARAVRPKPGNRGAQVGVERVLNALVGRRHGFDAATQIVVLAGAGGGGLAIPYRVRPIITISQVDARECKRPPGGMLERVLLIRNRSRPQGGPPVVRRARAGADYSVRRRERHRS